MQLFTFDLSLPILLAAFSLCTSMLAVLGTVQLVVSAPSPAPAHGPHSVAHHRADVEIGMALQKRSIPWWGTVSPTDPHFVPLESRPPLSMAKLIMLRHAETQRRANSRARMRQAQFVY